MARLNLVMDYAVPGVVGLGELGLKAIDRSRLQANPAAMELEPLLPYAVGIAGTVARVMGMLPRYDEHMKMAIAASMPRIVTGAYDWATTAAGAPAAARRRVRGRQVRERGGGGGLGNREDIIVI